MIKELWLRTKDQAFDLMELTIMEIKLQYRNSGKHIEAEQVNNLKKSKTWKPEAINRSRDSR